MLSTVSVILATVALVTGSAIPHATVSSQYHSQDEHGQYSYGYAGGPSSKSETKTADGVVRGEYSYIDAHGIIQTAHYIADPHHGFRVVATNDPSGPLAHSAAVAHPIAAPYPVPVAHPTPVAHHVSVAHATPVAHVSVAHATPVAHPVPVAHATAVAHHVPVAHSVATVGHYRQPTVYEAGLIPGVDTPEVQIARAAHLHTVAETKARDALINSYPHPHGASYVPYAAAHSHYSYYLPTQVKDTPEVEAAKAAHFAAVHEAKAKIAHANSQSYKYSHSSNFYSHPAHSYYIPVPVKDTPEVAAAKAAHFAAVHEAKSKIYYDNSHYGYYPYASSHSYHVPVPVTDTPEVTAAKSAHFAAVHETKVRDAHYGHSDYSYHHAALPVTDTPEVAHAKAAHLAAHHSAHNSYLHQW